MIGYRNNKLQSSSSLVSTLIGSDTHYLGKLCFLCFSFLICNIRAIMYIPWIFGKWKKKMKRHCWLHICLLCTRQCTHILSNLTPSMKKCYCFHFLIKRSWKPLSRSHIIDESKAVLKTKFLWPCCIVLWKIQSLMLKWYSFREIAGKISLLNPQLSGRMISIWGPLAVKWS